MFGITYWFTVLLLSRNRPTIYLDNFNVVSLRNTTATYLNLRIQNENSWIGIYYEDALNLTISYLPPTKSIESKVTIGQCAIQGFYQGQGEVRHIQASVVIEDLFSMTEQRRRLGETHVSLYGPVKVIDFVVDLEANIKFKSIENKKSHLLMQSGVEVNDDTWTSILKTVQMNDDSGSNTWGVWRWIVAVPLIFLLQIVLGLGFWLALKVVAFVSVL
ncbi:unnamed protein product [Lactuca saligna]|uniref:Uncharacterized protein n=1 Tax=Lactuca saligna TaxID=75948 RepID=A0AA36EBW7_LACSI|nr:unnamed protein product [Lactuca saligna]